MKKRSAELVAGLNKIKGVNVTAIPNGTNIYRLQRSETVHAGAMRERLKNEFNIEIMPVNESKQVMLTMNETLLNQDVASLLKAFETSINS
jgi:hypothetical protein